MARPVAVASVFAATLADDAPAITLGRSAPHARLLAEAQGMVETRLLDHAAVAHTLGCLRFGFVVRVEDGGVEAAAGTEVPPLRDVWTDLFDGHVATPLAVSHGERRPRPFTATESRAHAARAPEICFSGRSMCLGEASESGYFSSGMPYARARTCRGCDAG